jgi:ribosomal protein L19
MTKTVVIKGHVVGPRTVELAEPVPGDTREVEVMARVPENASAQDRLTGRSRELAWREANKDELQAFAGEWVVLEGEQIVAHGPDPAELVAAARRSGVPVPYVFFVDRPQIDVVKIGL